MKKFYVIFIATVMLVFAVPSLLLLVGVENENRENRPLATLPELFDVNGINEGFTAQFSKYIDENFALREYLITAYNVINVNMINDYAGNSVFIGENDMLYFADSVDDYLGINQMSADQIELIAEYLYMLQNDFKSQGVEFIFVTAPNKASVYPEFMPDFLYRTENNTNIDMLNTAMSDAGVNYIDAKAVLSDAKRNSLVYYCHDSHWNNFGAMLIYNEIAERIGSEVYLVDIFEEALDYTGDLHNFVYPSLDYFEKRIVYSVGHEYTSLRPINFNRDQYVETYSAANELSVMLYHDSFGWSLQPIISASVGKLRMSRVFPYDFSYVYDEKTDVVIIELVERNLNMLYDLAVEAVEK